MKQTQILVVGGGMVGAATALALAQSGFEVCLLEKRPPDLSWSAESPYHPRVSALTRASENFLASLNAWSGIEARRLQPFTAMHVWAEDAPKRIDLEAAAIGEPNLGHVVENSVVQAALWDQVMAQPLIRVYADGIAQLEETEDAVHVTLTSGTSLQAQLVVGADGAFSTVRTLAGIGLDTHDYAQAAIVGCVRTERSNHQACWQRYQASGPFAFLTLGDHVSSIAWYLPLEQQDWALSLNDAEFARAVTQASNGFLGEVTEVGARAAFPLIRRHAQHYVRPRVVLVGDAAHTVHPQAGQGVNLGLLDAAALAEVLTEAKSSHGLDWGRRTVLRRYERWRRGDNLVVQRAMEGFDWLYTTDEGLAKGLRRRVLPLADHFSGMKHWLMQQALHGRGRLPRACQPQYKGQTS
ncbi:UbiH/UbiF/VisC/COQ6 family ubiquinone biosynthesis hydroxylase [Hydrogenovibrio halophilus]|uniref:UbiH/UbiF/VisC/COQ6 family ubiquinone biosynthesis hydroxylase n=1 Tax=Hydrogenovibrio halophilus TaxID=373391 RepID=UPI00035C32D8|nr:UbiH/UbiF/VisC/COQ6 family ubiquinone biosynthesis hydroxylase [Hydrogenovibrio halophilus]